MEVWEQKNDRCVQQKIKVKNEFFNVKTSQYAT